MSNPSQSDTSLNPFGITREEILNMAAQKIADQYADDFDPHEMFTRKIDAEIKAMIANGMKEKIDSFLREKLHALVEQEIVPVNMWGEREGQPTTIKAQLALQAKQYWDTKVNENGAVASYGGIPRSEYIFRNICKEEFAKAITQNITDITGAFKDAIIDNNWKLVREHIDKVLHVKTNK